jgi:hypothetical protein
MINLPKSKMKLAILIFAFLFVMINIVALTIVNWGDKEGKLGLKTLHKSTAGKTSSAVNANQAIFYDSKRVLIAEDKFNNKNVHFVDLESGTTKKLSLETNKKLVIQEFIPLKDKAIAIYYSGDDYFAYMVDKNGSIFKLKYFDQGTEKESVKDKQISDYISSNPNIKLTRIDLSSKNSKSDTRGFYNDEVFFTCYNATTCQTFNLLKSKSIKDEDMYKFEVTNGFIYREFGINIERNSDGVENNDLDANYFNWIKKVKILKDGKVLKEYPVSGSLYATIVPINDRIYFVGKSVKYVELKDLEEVKK